MNIEDIRRNAFAMPLHSPAYPRPPFRFMQREYFIVTYETDPDALRAVVPEPLVPDGNLVNYEFIRMPDSSGFGNYTESGQVIPVLDPEGRKGSYTHAMYLDDEGPIAGGREIWGFPKKLGSPRLSIDGHDTLLGTLNYGSQRIATGTMGYKFRALDIAAEQRALADTPNYLLKVIPHVDGSARICELVCFHLRDVTVHGAWQGPGALELHAHALAPVADLPVRRVVSAKHLLVDLTLDIGEVAFDYLTPAPAPKLVVNQ
ncbi:MULTISPECIES: acetoacetate decarboxylase [unclassified Cupriavidus]|uniref:acetoacetate decarboxylase n=1 Tax=unclassified Cupriavidus TaxID=2640874 RepID=UPI001C00419F|nr:MULTISPECIES: acetoacetate decarboxylase [unclassified Cupriavidus]MCA3188027.1 acetoacetate decarboxylase [Cupriavidus sp.]MCA3194068.1 acetoacetate decarboxylase [Cupriavidus sp.]MCA3200292.1 acetoacetate decarboxylase [Cupriavidus sp.]MCA3232801.1 acetoacetate decarboxylase [Cupriavidus sp.]QWE97580.1 acetoacetate decarboxylase [Cupriavidus sp. EM10]